MLVLVSSFRGLSIERLVSGPLKSLLLGLFLDHCLGAFAWREGEACRPLFVAVGYFFLL